MATSGAMQIGVKAVPPIPPSDEIVKVAPDVVGAHFPSRAFAASSPVSLAI